MQTQAEKTNAQEALNRFMPKMAGRLHALVKEVHEGNPAISCIWNEAPTKTCKEVIFVGSDPGFDALTIVRTVNKQMKASESVVSMLIDLYTSQHKTPVGEGVEY